MTGEEFKELVAEMKEFFSVGSLEGVAEKLWYNKSVANTWRSRKAFSKTAILRYNLLKSKSNQSDSTDTGHSPNPHF